ncbi:MAG: S-layer homology domain-containing protein [Clostridiaceae bacterium]|nr:S-layer homology domain-containing protein [Clostridiaceae bacterium]
MKKLVSVVLTLMLVMSMLTGMASAVNFNDIWNHWAYDEIVEMANAGVIRGYADGTFRPDQTITRAEFVALIVRRYQPTGSYDVVWPIDVSRTDWYYDTFTQAAQAGLIPDAMLTGKLFRSDDAITREQAAYILDRVLKLDASGAFIYSDRGQISVYAMDAVKRVTTAGIFGGYADGTFRPKGELTRAEVAAVLARLARQEAEPQEPVPAEDEPMVLSVLNANYTAGRATTVTLYTTMVVGSVRIMDEKGNIVGVGGSKGYGIWTISVTPMYAGQQVFTAYASTENGAKTNPYSFTVNVAQATAIVAPVTEAPQVAAVSASSLKLTAGDAVILTVTANSAATKIHLLDSKGVEVAVDTGIYQVVGSSHVFTVRYIPTATGKQTFTLVAGDAFGYYPQMKPVAVTLEVSTRPDVPAVTKVTTSTSSVPLGGTFTVTVTTNTKATRACLADATGTILAEQTSYTTSTSGSSTVRVFTFLMRATATGSFIGYAYAGNDSGYTTANMPFSMTVSK